MVQSTINIQKNICIKIYVLFKTNIFWNISKNAFEVSDSANLIEFNGKLNFKASAWIGLIC